METTLETSRGTAPRARARGVLALALASVLAFGTAAAPAAAEATAEDEVTSYSSAWRGDPGSVRVQTQVTGVVGWLLAPVLNPILDGIVSPLLSNVGNLPNALLSPLLGVLFGQGLEANTPLSTVTPVPSPSLLSATAPATAAHIGSCAEDPATCYAAGSILGGASGLLDGLGSVVSPLIGLSLASAQGVTERLSSPGRAEAAQSQLAGLELDLLSSVPVLDTGLISSQTICPASAAELPSAASTTGGISLLGGLLEVQLAQGTGTPAVQVLAGGYDLAQLETGIEGIRIAGVTAGLRLDGSLLRLELAVGVQPLFAALGLPGLGSVVTNLADLKAALGVVIGNGSVIAPDSAEAWGLGLGVDLALDVELNVLGLVGLRIVIPSGVTAGADPGVGRMGNLLDLRLAYSRCYRGAGVVEEEYWIGTGLT